jgi:hypothetical protein
MFIVLIATIFGLSSHHHNNLKSLVHLVQNRQIMLNHSYICINYYKQLFTFS